VFRWIADPSHAKIDGDFPHSYEILISGPTHSWKSGRQRTGRS
jgi:hypothetical protein